MVGTWEVHNSVVLKLTTSSKNIFFRKIRDGNKISGNQRECLNQWTNEP